MAEELAYRGYAQPRLTAQTGSRLWGVLIVAFGFGLQHIGFAFTDWQAALGRFIGTFLAGLVLGPVYLKQQRLLPLIIAHWLVDVVGLGSLPAPVLPERVTRSLVNQKRGAKRLSFFTVGFR